MDGEPGGEGGSDLAWGKKLRGGGGGVEWRGMRIVLFVFPLFHLS